MDDDDFDEKQETLDELQAQQRYINSQPPWFLIVAFCVIMLFILRFIQ